MVERPASVVKELIENSLDAQATRIIVKLEAGGQRLIQVQDNGHGITAQDLPLALTRHATSKLFSLNDLQAINSFGFRGEALPSIASVSHLTISSISSEQKEGHFVEVMFGRIIDEGPAAIPSGTKVKVENLLANVPARLKFLKKQTTEHKKCTDIFYRLSLANLDTDFELFSGSRSNLRFFSGESLVSRLQKIWPKKIVDGLKPFALETEGLHIHGLAGSPDTAQGRSERIYFYVNNRPVTDKLLLSALRQAYKGTLLSREFPQAVLFIDLPPDEVDVNVHPAKAEVRFRDEQFIFSRIVKAVGQIFITSIPVPELPKSNISPDSRPKTVQHLPLSPATQQNRSAEQPIEPFRSSEPEFVHDPVQDTYIQYSNFSGVSNAPLQSLNEPIYLGQIDKTYLLLKINNQFIILDQHAAHERILYEQNKRRGFKGVKKNLVLPIEIGLQPGEQKALTVNWPKLIQLGFVLEQVTPERVLIKAVPKDLNSGQAKEFLHTLLSREIDTLDQMWILMACRAAIKAGQELTNDEAMGLVDSWLACPNKDYCPHGRPVAIVLENRLLEKMFKRK
ncbi:DNA mismatch repair endonuclease MutL [Desulfohalobiaceae bacterium Ax17]|nr:DNA mismatch repair endonuclease MutL [Desulfovulcanus ferrireducens]